MRARTMVSRSTLYERTINFDVVGDPKIISEALLRETRNDTRPVYYQSGVDFVTNQKLYRVSKRYLEKYC